MDYLKWNQPGIIAGTTLRFGGYSSGPYSSANMAFYVGDDADAVVANRNRLADAVGIPLDHWVFPKITHSDHLVKVTAADQGKGALSEKNSIIDTDAIYTTEPGIVLAVFHADCVPILLYVDNTSLICAIHAGWQGTINEITAKVVSRLIIDEQIDPHHIHAYIGPSISQKHFEIDTPVLKLMKSMSFDVHPFLVDIDAEHALFDAAACNIHQLKQAGVLAKNITDSHQCTYENEERFYSFRRDKNTGRHISYIAMTESQEE